MMRLAFLFFLIFGWGLGAFAQNNCTVRGLVTGADSTEALSFASIYVQGTSLGTTTNLEGRYELVLPQDTHILVFQYVGYQPVERQVILTEKTQVLDISLRAWGNDLAEVVVTPDGEDPAYRIIRQAIKKRRFFLEQVRDYRCQAYVKGVQRLTNVPSKIMGQSLDELRKGLDSTGSGIVYLSESVSELQVRGNDRKETMISSKISGDDNGFSWNSGAAMLDFSFYENEIELGDSRLLSPIGQGALSAYRYELLNSFRESGRLVHQIRVEPKNELGQLFRGTIYIVEGEWAIHSAELFTTGKAANISVMDTIAIRQLHVALPDSIWRMFSQDIQFKMNIFGIKINGKFTGVFRQYELNPSFERKTFNAEVFTVSDTANKRSQVYWDSIRPVPLTPDELREYTTKDSLQKIWKTKDYMDSLDRVRNKFNTLALITGYTHLNTYRHRLWTINSPASSLQFNTVQGWYGDLSGNYRQGRDEDWTSWWDVGGKLQYGWADKQWRGMLRFQYKFNDINEAKGALEAGRQAVQFSEREPISATVNSLYSLYGERNYLKLYDKYYSKIEYSQYLTPQLWGMVQVQYAQRKALTNHVNRAWRDRPNRTFFSNAPLDFRQPALPDQPSFGDNSAFQIDVYLRLRIGQKYVSYPRRRFYSSTKAPDIWVHYRKAVPLFGTNADFDYISMTVQKEDVALGRFGLLSYCVRGGIFLTSKEMYFMDFRHFSGNRTIFAKSDAYLQTFQLLPYYAYSTQREFAEFHLQYDCNGFLWNKMPGLKKLGFEWVAGYRLLLNPEVNRYMEASIGIDRIGWKMFRFLRVDFVTSFQYQKSPRFGGVVGLKFSI